VGLLDRFRLDGTVAVVTGSGRGIGRGIALGLAEAGAYAAAKAGALNLTLTMAAELAPRGIRVNSVSPGPVPTEAFLRVLDFTEPDLLRLASTVPLGRLGTPEDIAAAVLYLASPAAAWVTGQNILVSGGREGGRSVEDR
jgi:NAD(P)-dependent dehydrogenase (short-subunit alcohol dehydrogenase family)